MYNFERTKEAMIIPAKKFKMCKRDNAKQLSALKRKLKYKKKIDKELSNNTGQSIDMIELKDI